MNGIPLHVVTPLCVFGRTLTWLYNDYDSIVEASNALQDIMTVCDKAIVDKPHEILLLQNIHNERSFYSVAFVDKFRYDHLEVVIATSDYNMRLNLLEQIIIINKRFKLYGFSVSCDKVINSKIVLSYGNIERNYSILEKYDGFLLCEQSCPIISIINYAIKENDENIIINYLLWQRLRPLFAAVKARQSRLTYDALWLIGQYYIL